jgi:hypothetical protein
MKRFIISYSDILEYPERQKKPKDNPLEFVKGQLVNSINKAMLHIFYAMLLMQNKKVPDNANDLDITQLKAEIEAEIGEIIG